MGVWVDATGAERAHGVVKMIANGNGIRSVEAMLRQVSIADLETKLARKSSDWDSGEYRRTVRLYAAKIASENAKGKVVEFCKEFCGTEEEVVGWNDNVFGLSRRELLKEVLVIFAGNRGLQQVVEEFHERIREFERKEVDDSRMEIRR